MKIRREHQHSIFKKGTLMWRIALCTILLISTGCYRYAAIEGVAPRSGERVRVELTDQGTAELARLLGPGPVAIAGRVLTADDGELTLGVQAVAFRRREEQFWVGERLSIPRPLIARVERRTLSRTRTALTTVASLVAAVLVVDFFTGGEALFGGKRDGGGQPTG